MIPQKNTYPIFEANQVLTKAHLNQLLEYLDEQTRISRTNLFGVGIVCGLKVSWDENRLSISVSKGCGVTTEGYLVNIGVIGNEKADKCKPVDIADFSADRYKKYNLPANPGYPKFHPNCNTSNTQYELWQLIPAGAADYDTAISLSTDFLADKVALLYVELNDEQLKNCSPNSCDDKGREAIFTIRPLLISRTNAEKLNIELEGQDTLPNLTERLDLPHLRMPRLNVPSTNLEDARQIFEAYKTLLLDGSETMFHKIGAALTSVYQVFKPVVVSVEPNYNFNAELQKLEDQFRNLFAVVSLKSKTPVFYAQYYYDLLSDLIQAYDEFRWKALEMMALCCPHEALFPRHLLLGEVLVAQPELRHHFRPSMAIAHAATTAEEVRHLFERMVLMIEKFRVSSSASQGIRITPTYYGDFPLSKKSIPYYYLDGPGRTPLYQRWNYAKTRIGKARQNLSYHSPDYAEDEVVKNPLHYDLEAYNFFRIEGHIGRSWTEVLDAILKSIKTYRLPFDVVVLNADNLAVEDKENPWKNRCIDNDLDVIHRLWVNEINCLYRQKIPALTQPKTPRGLPFLKPFVVSSGQTSETTVAPSSSGSILGSLINTETRSASTLSAQAASGKLASLLPRTSPIFGGINPASNPIGDIILKNADKEEINTIDKFKNEVSKELAKKEEYAGLSLKEYKVVAEHKVAVVADMIAVTEELSKEPGLLDHARIDDKFTLLDNSIGAYLNDLAIYNPNDNDSTLTEAEVQALIKELQALQSTCLRNRLNELKKEVDAKRKAIDQLIWFSRFAVNHPDLQHKAGVPVGGTFVLVFRETVGDQVVSFNRFQNYDIPEGKVLADFFLPNRCCSDCPPVKFVLPPSRPTFSVSLRCPDENDVVFVDIDVTHGVPPFEIKVDGGTYALLSNGGVSLNPGEHTLVVRDLEGGESLARKVTTGQRMKVKAIKFNCNAADTFFVARLQIEHGKPPFKLDGVDVAHTAGTGPEAGLFFIETPSLASGQVAKIKVDDNSGCDPFSLEIDHTCKTSTILLTPDVGTTKEGTPVSVNVLGNDIGNTLVLTEVRLENAAMGTVVINNEGGLTYTPSAAAVGQQVVINYDVKNANGTTASSTVTITVTKKCDLPGNGKAVSSLYRLWIQPPAEEVQYQKVTVKIRKLEINDNLDLTAIVPSFPNETGLFSILRFHDTMREWVKKLNDTVQSKVPADQKNWWQISYVTDRNNNAFLRIEHFTAFDFDLTVEGSLQFTNSVQTDFTTTLTSKTGTKTSETRQNLTSVFQLPPFDRIDLDKCLGTEKARCTGEVPKISIEVKDIQDIQGIRGQRLVSLEGVDPRNLISSWFWDMGQGVSDKPNAVQTSVSFKSGLATLQTIKLFGFTKLGCFVMATKVIDLDGRDGPLLPPIVRPPIIINPLTDSDIEPRD